MVGEAAAAWPLTARAAAREASDHRIPGPARVYVWAGLFVPKGVPADVMGRLQNTVMNYPQIIGILNKAGSPPAYLDAAEFAAYIETDSKRLIATVHRIGKLD